MSYDQLYPTFVKTEKAEYSVYRVNNDVYGNPRYVISWLSIGLKGYYSTKLTRQAGLSIYRGANFGGGFAFQSYNIEESLKHFEKILGL